MANHLAIYVLRQWRRSIRKGFFRPPVGYLVALVCSMPVDIFYEPGQSGFQSTSHKFSAIQIQALYGPFRNAQRRCLGWSGLEEGLLVRNAERAVPLPTYCFGDFNASTVHTKRHVSHDAS
ncbi:uncharacterized protein LACBIDRAFT_297948 [Laccaria bicolor S238N-H82]|uniref:Predicted protein n=1 Tax=Laccaria bicolor (strain S238N-H82 / ATCC MYA-4686) TaxID=486041 RepID=B0DBW7_LACBS|nr:uncharacterized protein LACBIDRAFT_297948 [Laccaria bicolor S238N-H82]EDR07632.1 predicted protein [Laccaria bicolor S238N-H82]|eukprot:XP_001881421.1 predicted protein [Laccaria bicolor S238N-H82]